MPRSDTLYHAMIDQTVAHEFFAPALMAFDKVRFSDKPFSALPMSAFCFFGCLRHLQGTPSLRELIQQLFHYDNTEQLPVARSTFGDALNSSTRRPIVSQMVQQLGHLAKAQLPDRLAEVIEVSGRDVYAVDGSYQQESAHYCRRAPKDGGSDNPKGHMMLTVYDVKMGAPVELVIETQNRHELLVLKGDRDRPESRLRQRNALWVADRAFVDMPFWDEQKRRFKQTLITRMKSNLVIEHRRPQDFAMGLENAGVLSDELLTLKASKESWRRIRFQSPEGDEYEFLTNDLQLSPGAVAFLYLRRWDEEKCFDTWKNDFASKKAWSKSVTGIRMQGLLAIVTSILCILFIHHHQDQWGIADEKSLKKQKQRLDKLISRKSGYIPWQKVVYRYTAKISRQVIRFLKFNFTKKSSQQLYEKQLRPLLLKYL